MQSACSRRTTFPPPWRFQYIVDCSTLNAFDEALNHFLTSEASLYGPDETAYHTCSMFDPASCAVPATITSVLVELFTFE